MKISNSDCTFLSAQRGNQYSVVRMEALCYNEMAAYRQFYIIQAIFDTFADKSVSAAATAKEEIAIDDKTMGKLIEAEIERINIKHQSEGES